jgi:hypothetical protein
LIRLIDFLKAIKLKNNKKIVDQTKIVAEGAFLKMLMNLMWSEWYLTHTLEVKKSRTMFKICCFNHGTRSKQDQHSKIYQIQENKRCSGKRQTKLAAVTISFEQNM